MIKSNSNAQEYKTPVCKTVKMALGANYLQSTSPIFGGNGEAGGNLDPDDGYEYTL